MLFSFNDTPENLPFLNETETNKVFEATESIFNNKVHVSSIMMKTQEK